MAKLKYDSAVYRDENTHREITIRAEELGNPSVALREKSNTLYDVTGQIELIARIGTTNAHHFAEKAETKICTYPLVKEKDPSHDKRVEEILQTILSTGLPWKICALELRKKPGQQSYDRYSKELFVVENYQWGKEVHRILDSETVVRHDLFGQSNDIRMSKHRPWIAIEVIHTHYPEEDMFSKLLSISREIPLLVLFESIISRTNFSLVVDSTSQMLTAVYYIFDGSLWKFGSRCDISTAIEFEQEMENVYRPK